MKHNTAMNKVLRFFKIARLIPHEFYTFYNYAAGVEVRRERLVSNHRTLGILKRFARFLFDNPDALLERQRIFPSTPSEYSY